MIPKIYIYMIHNTIRSRFDNYVQETETKQKSPRSHSFSWSLIVF